MSEKQFQVDVAYFNDRWLNTKTAQSGHSNLCLSRFYFLFHHRSNRTQPMAVKRFIFVKDHFGKSKKLVSLTFFDF